MLSNQSLFFCFCFFSNAVTDFTLPVINSIFKLFQILTNLSYYSRMWWRKQIIKKKQLCTELNNIEVIMFFFFQFISCNIFQLWCFFSVFLCTKKKSKIAEEKSVSINYFSISTAFMSTFWNIDCLLIYLLEEKKHIFMKSRVLNEDGHLNETFFFVERCHRNYPIRFVYIVCCMNWKWQNRNKHTGRRLKCQINTTTNTVVLQGWCLYVYNTVSRKLLALHMHISHTYLHMHDRK